MAFDVEEVGVPTFNGSRSSLAATRKIWLKTPGDLLAYLQEVLGVTETAGAGFIRTLPVAFPGIPWLFVDNVSVRGATEGVGGKPGICTDSNGLASDPNGWLITIKYKTVEFTFSGDNEDVPDLPDDTYLSISGTMGMDIVSTDNDGLEWEQANDDSSKELSVRTSVPKREPTSTWQMTWHNIADPPWTAISQYRGVVNDRPFFGAAAETVQFLGMDFRREFQINGTRAWQLDYRFEVKQIAENVGGSVEIRGWNHFLRDDPGASDPEYQRVVSKTDNSALYLKVDLSFLFKTEAVGLSEGLPVPEKVLGGS